MSECLFCIWSALFAPVLIWPLITFIFVLCPRFTIILPINFQNWCIFSMLFTDVYLVAYCMPSLNAILNTGLVKLYTIIKENKGKSPCTRQAAVLKQPQFGLFLDACLTQVWLYYANMATCIKELPVYIKHHKNNTIKRKYCVWPNYSTYPYKRTVKQFRSLQITASVLFVYFFIKAYGMGTHLNCNVLSMQFEWVPTTYVL